jgi:hypothetical protein
MAGCEACGVAIAGSDHAWCIAGGGGGCFSSKSLPPGEGVLGGNTLRG